MTILSKALLAGFVWATASSAALAAWPERPIRWIVPFAAGGATDALSRVVADKLGPLLGQTVIVENVPGASGVLGLERITRATPDGYLVGTSPNSMQTMLPYLADTPLSFDTMKDLTPLGGLASFQYVIDVAYDSPIKTLGDLIERARSQPESVSVGTAGVGTGTHLSTVLLAYKTGVKFNDILYKGNAPALTDLMGGHIDFVVDPVGGSLGHIGAKKLRAIAATGSKRLPLLPDVPLVSETVPGYEHIGWFGLYGPANMPADVVKQYSDALVKLQKDPDVIAAVEKFAYEPMPVSSAELDERQQKEYADWGKILKETGLTKDRGKPQ